MISSVKRLFWIYFIMVHVLIGTIFLRSDYLQGGSRKQYFTPKHPQHEITVYYYRMLTYHQRSVDIVPDNALIVIGDSIVQGLCVSAIKPNSVNYGIGRDTTFGVLQRLPIYMPALKRAQAVVVAIGTNDFMFRDIDKIERNYEQILSVLPSRCTIVVSSVMPVDENVRNDLVGRNQLIGELNQRLRLIVAEYTNVVFLDNNSYLDTNSDSLLDSEFHVGDGVHLNSKGNALWAANIKRLLR
jgi:lysophospholipase L1-like esterase